MTAIALLQLVAVAHAFGATENTDACVDNSCLEDETSLLQVSNQIKERAAAMETVDLDSAAPPFFAWSVHCVDGETALLDVDSAPATATATLCHYAANHGDRQTPNMVFEPGWTTDKVLVIGKPPGWTAKTVGAGFVIAKVGSEKAAELYKIGREILFPPNGEKPNWPFADKAEADAAKPHGLLPTDKQTVAAVVPELRPDKYGGPGRPADGTFLIVQIGYHQKPADESPNLVGDGYFWRSSGFLGGDSKFVAVVPLPQSE